MCKFCYKLGEEDSKKDITWQVRSCLTAQTVDSESIDKELFELKPQNVNGSIYMGIYYTLETNNNINVYPFSENSIWLYCPFCGRKISKEDHSDINDTLHGIVVEDQEWEMYSAWYGESKEPWENC